MATHDYVIDNSTGANVRADINLVLQAILTNNSSSSAPSTTAAYMFWADTTSGTLKIRNSSDNAWVELLQLDGTLTLEDGSASTPGLAFRDDLNTGIFSSAADTFNVATGGVERMELGATTIFNEDGADVDFRIEGDTEANLFYVDAGNDRVGIGQSAPEGLLHIENASSGATYSPDGADVVIIENSDSVAIDLRSPAANSCSINFSDTVRRRGGITYSHSTDAFSFLTSGSVATTIDSSGRLLIGTSTSKSTSAGQYGLLNIQGGAGTTENFVAFSRNEAASAMSADDEVSNLTFTDSVGYEFARIKVLADAATGTADTPGRLVFLTTPDGASAAQERLRIDKDGNVSIGISGTTNKFHVEGTTTGSRFGVDTSSSGIPAIAATNESNADIELVIYDGRSSIGSSVNIPIAFHTNGKTNERMRLSTSGELLVGMSNSQAVAGGSAKIQVQATDSTGRISIVQHRNEASGAPFLSLGKTRATSTNNSTLVQNGDNLGTIAFAGGDGTDIQSTAVQIVGVVSDSPGSNDMPGSLEIYTTPNGSDSPKKRINLTHKGEFQMGNSIGSSNIINQISRASGNTTETITPTQLGLDDNNYALLYIVVSGTSLQDWGHSLVSWRMPRGGNSSLVTQVDAMASGSSVGTFTQAVNTNDLVITKDSDLDLSVTVIGGGGRRTTIGWG